MVKIIQIVKALKKFATALGNIKVAIQEDTVGLAKSADVSNTQPRNVAQWGGTPISGRDVTKDLEKLQNLDILLSALRDAITAEFRNVQASLLGADETVAQSITLDANGRTVVSFQAWATAATTFTLEASFDGVNWRTVKTYSAVTEASEGFLAGMRYWRLSSAAAGVAGDKVNLVLQAGR